MDFVDVLLFVAVVTAEKGGRFLAEVEDSQHRFVVCYALRVVTLYYSTQCLWSLNGNLLYYLVVADDVHDDLWSDYREFIDFLRCKESITDFNNSFSAKFVRWVVIANSYRVCLFVKTEKRYYLKSFGCGYMVDNSAILDGCHEAFFLIHR